MARPFSLARLRRDLAYPDAPPFPEIFLVGGTVRDAFLGRRGRRDIDLAVAEGEEEVARRLSDRGWGKAFRIAGARHGISVWRVAGPDGIVDVAKFGGAGGLLGDLGRRDFTINAMARDVRTGRLFDPFGGRRDLQRRLIRAICPSNFDEDPLRLLRAYRLAAQLPARIAPGTRKMIRARAGALSGVAAERVRDELMKLLNASGPDAALAIAAACRDGVMSAALGFSAGWRVAPGPIRRTEGEDALVDRLALLFRRAGSGAAEAGRLLAARRFGASRCRNVCARLRFLAAALDRPFDGRSLHHAFSDASSPSKGLVSASAKTPAERRRARRLGTWLRRANLKALPVTGDEIAGWLDIPSGPLLGRTIAEARYRNFIGEWTGRRMIRDGLRRWVTGGATH